MEWHLGLEGQGFSDLTAEKRRIMQQSAPETEEGWRALATLALEVLGLRQAVRIGDPRLWRQAVSELNTVPLAPLNLPLPVWELYLAHPYEGVTLRMHDGQQITVPEWSKLYYCWHSRWFAVHEEKIVRFIDGMQIAGGEAVHSPNIQNTVLERLLWLQKAESKVVFVVRTREGRSVVIDGKTNFRVDPSGSLLIVKQGEDLPIDIIPIKEIVAVFTGDADEKAVRAQVIQRLKATPFTPFHVSVVHGNCYTVRRPQAALLTADMLFLGEAGDGEAVYDKVLKIPLTWVDRVESLPT